MATRTYKLFSTSALEDPIERDIAPIVYVMLLGLGAARAGADIDARCSLARHSSRTPSA